MSKQISKIKERQDESEILECMYEYVPISCIQGHHHTGRQDRSENGVLPPGFLSIERSLEKRESSERVQCMARSSCCLLRKIKQRPGGRGQGGGEEGRKGGGEEGGRQKGREEVRERNKKNDEAEKMQTDRQTYT